MNIPQENGMAECLAKGQFGPELTAKGLSSGAVSAAGRLDELLRSDPAARQEFRNQSELDALLRLRAGRLSVSANMSQRVRRTIRHRRLRIALEFAVAAVIVIGFSLSYVMWTRQQHPSREAVQSPSTVTQPAQEPGHPKQPGGSVPPGSSSVPPVPAPPGGG